MLLASIVLLAKLVGADTPLQAFFYTVCSYIILGILALGAFTAFIALPIAILVYLIKWGKYMFDDHADEAVKELCKGFRKIKG